MPPNEAGWVTTPILLDDLLAVLHRYRQAYPDQELRVIVSKRTLMIMMGVTNDTV